MILGMAATGNQLVPGKDQKDGIEMDSTEYNKTIMAIGSQVNSFAIDPKVDKATSPVLDTIDIAGYNYGTARYTLDQTEHPNRLIVGTETYPQNLASNWELVKKLPNVIGDFMWTAWDYIGEAGIGAWSYVSDARDFFKPYPWKLADAGAFDLNGQPTGEALWAKAIWHHTKTPLIGVRPVGHKQEPFKSAWRGTNALPTWTWPNCDGQDATVEVYFDCSFITLYLNDIKIETKETKHSRTIFNLPYTPGELMVKASDENHQLLATGKLRTAEELKIHWVTELKLTNDNLNYINIWLGDNEGNFSGNASNLIVASETNGKLLGFGSAQPRTEESYHTPSVHLYHGQALAIIAESSESSWTIKFKEK